MDGFSASGSETTALYGAVQILHVYYIKYEFSMYQKLYTRTQQDTADAAAYAAASDGRTS